MSKFVGTSFPGNASQGDTFRYIPRLPEWLEYLFLGGDPASALNWVIIDGVVSSDPDITGWGNNQRGAKWFNVTTMQWTGFNGIELVLLG